MGKYSVPEHIRECKPKGTLVKLINGHYYVYEYKKIEKDGKSISKATRCIGKIEEGYGFIPNARGGSGQDEEATDPRDVELRQLRLRVAELEATLRLLSETALSAAAGQASETPRGE